MLLVPQVQVEGGKEIEEGGSGLTSEAERAYWIGQQLIWNPYPSCWLEELFILMQCIFLAGPLLHKPIKKVMCV